MIRTPRVLNVSKWAWAGRWLLCLACIASLITGIRYALANIDSGLYTPQPSDHILTYDVYAGGIHALEATFYLDVNKPDSYSVFLEARTRGLLGKLAPWSGTFESHGWRIEDIDFRPKIHKSTSTWQGEYEIKSYEYKKDRTFAGLSIKEHEKPFRQETIDPALADGTVDVLSAALSVFSDVNRTQKCAGQHDVFDGKRRFELVFDHKDNSALSASKYNVYDGPASECSIEVVPVSGQWHKKPRGWLSIQEQGRKRGTMPTIWVAPLIEDSPYLPVKIRVKTAYGTLFMHLAEYKNGQKHFTAQKRQDK